MEKSVREILKGYGYIVTNRCFADWNKSNRMITTVNGIEVGFFTPLKALKMARSNNSNNQNLKN